MRPSANNQLELQVFGLNRHTWDVPFSEFVPLRKVIDSVYYSFTSTLTKQNQFATEILYLYAAGLIKISILLFFLRFTITSATRKYKIMAWGLIAFVVVYILVYTVVLFVSCTPLSAIWNQVDIVSCLR